jgi:hypothetical protein
MPASDYARTTSLRSWEAGREFNSLDLASAGGLSISRIARLERRILAALRFERSARSNLRTAVRLIVDDLRRQGVEPSVVLRCLEFVTTNEVDHGDLNQKSMVDGKRPSEALLREIREWAAQWMTTHN